MEANGNKRRNFKLVFRKRCLEMKLASVSADLCNERCKVSPPSIFLKKYVIIYINFCRILLIQLLSGVIIDKTNKHY